MGDVLEKAGKNVDHFERCYKNEEKEEEHKAAELDRTVGRYAVAGGLRERER